MDNRRFLLALALSIAVIFGVEYFSPKPVAKPTTTADSTAHPSTASANSATPAATTPAGTTTSAQSTAPTAAGAAILAPAPASTPVVHAETTIVAGRPDSGAQYIMSSVGAVPQSIVMNAYLNRSRVGGKVDLATPGVPLLKYQVMANQGSPIDLSNVSFSTVQGGNTLIYQSAATTPGVPAVSLHYVFAPENYSVHVDGNVPSIANGYFLVNLPTTFPITESDTADDRTYLAFSYLSKHDGARNLPFRSLDPGEEKSVIDPLTWVVAKSKYFVVGLLAPKGGAPFTQVTFVGGARTSKVATTAMATVAIPIKNGVFSFDLYTGPQSLHHLERMGRDFDEVNPYGWAFFRGIMQPIAVGVTQLVLWMHERLALSYGLVVVLLGVLIRVILWPLNQSAMRSSLKMQDLQPKMQALQNRYKDNPEKQQKEIMNLYKEHGMSPFSPIMGCLPMMLPMPVLFALYFVFRNTIEFRGVHFLWLTDLSSRDPYFILPAVMAVSMFLLSWIGMRNSPPNPQTKMMSYAMPLVFVVIMVRYAAGLNLYYAVQNLAALPQQWLIARERARYAKPSS